MCLADVRGGEDAEEGDVVVRRNLGEGAFDVEAAALFAVDQAEHTDHGHAGVARGLEQVRWCIRRRR